MSNPLDDALDNAHMEVEARMKKDATKRATKKSRTVEYTTPDAEGEAFVDISHDGERHFVEISVDIPWKGMKKIVAVDDDSLGGALAKAEEAFSETDYGSICLERLPDD